MAKKKKEPRIKISAGSDKTVHSVYVGKKLISFLTIYHEQEKWRNK